MKFKCGAETGKDMIPNKEFWKELPFLIKVEISDVGSLHADLSLAAQDGCIFSSIPIRKLYSRVFKRDHDGYETLK